jgi:2'-5' RNA ligase
VSAGRAGADAAIRAFFAIDLDDATRAVLSGVVERLRERAGDDRVRWLRPESLHVTLRFLGNVARERLAGIVREVRGAVAGVAPFRLQLGAVAGFPSRRRPRVIALSIPEDPRLARLAAAVEDAVVGVGLAASEGCFRPHLTLGRVREPTRSAVTVPVTGGGNSLAVDEIVLFRSELRCPGAVYTSLERIALGGNDHPTNLDV